ncbi:MAG: hypothetical protein IPM69_11175 [Ignavibacteria bacterium]|nr:hypothetical protein [Ignavibacteria bacterium]
MKNILPILLILALLFIPTIAKETKAKSKKSGTLSKIKDSATRGFGWGLGREAAKETVKGVKSLTRKGVDKVNEMKNNPSADK